MKNTSILIAVTLSVAGHTAIADAQEIAFPHSRMCDEKIERTIKRAHLRDHNQSVVKKDPLLRHSVGTIRQVTNMVVIDELTEKISAEKNESGGVLISEARTVGYWVTIASNYPGNRNSCAYIYRQKIDNFCRLYGEPQFIDCCPVESIHTERRPSSYKSPECARLGI